MEVQFHQKMDTQSLINPVGNYYEFKDIVEINFLKAVPDGISVEPNKLQVKYNDIIDETSEVELPTAQVKTDGDHVTITNMRLPKVTIQNTSTSLKVEK